MFRKLLNVGKGHSNEKLQQQQQQQKNLFQLNEIRSYGFSHLCCLGYSSSLSLLAVGSKYGLLRVLGNPSVEFSYQLESANTIRQIEFIDCRENNLQNNLQNGKLTQSKRSDQALDQAKKQASSDRLDSSADNNFITSAKIVVLTDNGQLHLFELRTFKQQNYSDGTTQTDNVAECCQQQQQQQQPIDLQATQSQEYTKLERVAQLDYFKYKLDDEDRSRRITTLEVSADGLIVFVGTEGGNLYQVPLSKFDSLDVKQQQQQLAEKQTTETPTSVIKSESANDESKEEETTAVNLNDEPQIEEVVEPFEMIRFDKNVLPQLNTLTSLDIDNLISKKQGAIESIKRHPTSSSKLLISYHRGLSVIFDIRTKSVDKFFYHNQVLESSCFADLVGDSFCTSHNDGSYIKWDARSSQVNAEDFLSQLYGPYPCKPAPKIQACTGLVNDQLEDLVIFSGGMPRATYDDKNSVTIVHTETGGKDTIKTVLDFTSKVLDFVVITRPRGNLGAGAKSTGAGGGGGKKNKHKKEQQQQQRNNPIAVALAILAEEEFVVIDLLNSESYLEFALPYLNCIHSSAITCNQHYSDVGDELYEQLLAYNKQQLKGKLSPNEWPITGGKVINAPEVKSHDILLTGHEDGSVDFWDVSDLSMRHLLHLSTARFFSTSDDDLVPIDGSVDNNNKQDEHNQDTAVAISNGTTTANNENSNANQQDAWPPLKRVGRFDPYSDDTRLAVRRLSLCPQTGTLVVAGTGGQVLVFELKDEARELEPLKADEVTIVNDQRFTWKGRGKLNVRPGSQKFEAGYQLSSYVQLEPPVAATSLDLRSEWHLYALGTSYGFFLYDYANKHCVVNKCTLNPQDFAIVSGDAPGTGAMSRKKSFRKSLRESFRRLRRGRSQRNQQVGGDNQASMAKPPAFGRVTTGVRTLNAPPVGGGPATTGVVSVGGAEVGVHRGVYSTERQVEQKVELSSIVKCITLTSAVITNNPSFKPTLWVGTNSGQVLVYAITLASEQQQAAVSSEAQSGEQQQDQQAVVPETPLTTARLAKEVQLKHKAPIIAIFTSPEAPSQQFSASESSAVDNSVKSSPEKQPNELLSSNDKSSSSDPSSPTNQLENRSDSVDGGERAQTPSTTPAPAPAEKVSPKKSDLKDQQQARVLICSEEQFKVFNLPNLKPFCKFKLTAHEGLRAKKISITQFLKPVSNKPISSSTTATSASGSLSASKSLQSFATQTSPPASPTPPAEGATSGSEANESGASKKGSGKKQAENNNNSVSTLNNNHTSSTKQDNSKELMNAKFGAKANNAQVEKELGGEQQQNVTPDDNLFEPYMVCMSNQGDCAIYSVPDLKRQAQIQVCKREDIIGITSTMLTNHGEGFYLKSSSNFLRFSISTQRVLRVLSVV